jgi:hypothetical protein
VVDKELLHHDILRELSTAGLLADREKELEERLRAEPERSGDGQRQCPRHGGPGILPGASIQKWLPISHPAPHWFCVPM